MYSTLKRISAWALTLVMLVGLFALPVANADDETVTLGFGTIEKADDTWKVPVIVTAAAGKSTYPVRAMQIYVTFDNEVLELTKVEKGNIPDTYDEDEEKSYALDLPTGKSVRNSANETGCYEGVFSDVASNKLNHEMTSGDPIVTLTFSPKEGKADQSSTITVQAPEGKRQRISRYLDSGAYEPYTVTAEQSETIRPNPGPNTYTVTFDKNGGDGTMTDQTFTEPNLTANLTANAFTRTGYNFSGWNTAADGSGTAYADGASYTASDNATLYAQWTVIPGPNTYTVTFDKNGGDGTMANQTFTAPNLTANLTPNAFTRSGGYTFKEWNTKADGTGTAYADKASYTASANVTLYAQWNAPNPPTTTYTVTFDKNGGDGTMANQTFTAPNLTANLTPNAFTRSGGYTFKEWNTKADGTGTSYADRASYTASANVTLYAQWNAPNPNPTPDSPGCYVATAVYGSYDCPQVWTLRRFRDNVLAETWYGRLFIKAYYAVSPTCVKLFGDTELFQNFFRGILDPWVADLQAEGFESTPYNDIDW